MSDEDLIGRIRAAVNSEAGPVDAALADRLLHGTARRRRTRRAAALTVAAVVLVGAGLAGATLRAGGDGSTLRIDSAGPDLGREGPAAEGTVTLEQAAREGADGTAECNAYAANNPGPGGGTVNTGATLYAAYLTDAQGLNQWMQEAHWGAGTVAEEPPATHRQLVALCWFTGNVGPGPDVTAPTDDYTHQFLLIQVDPPQPGPEFFLGDNRSPRAIAVVAPPVPTNQTSTAALRAFPQPPGVQILPELPARTPPEPDTAGHSPATEVTTPPIQYGISYTVGAGAYDEQVSQPAFDACVASPGASFGGADQSLPPGLSVQFVGTESQRAALVKCLRALPDTQLSGPFNLPNGS